MSANVPPMPDHWLSREGGRVTVLWTIIAVVLGLYFTAWWLHLRPGIFTYDSGQLLEEVLREKITNRKPFLFTRFIELTSMGGRWVQFTVLTQATIVVLIVSRAFAVALSSRVSPIWIAVCALLVLNPYVANMVFYLQNDVLFCFSIIAILVETLLVARRGRITLASLVIVALASPMAFAFRENGLLFLPLWWILVLFLGRDGRRLVAVSALSTVLAYASIWGVDREKSHDLMYPAVIHEVTRLAQNDWRHGIGGALAPETRDAVGVTNLQAATKVYWPLYWDTVGFHPAGPSLAYLPSEQRRAIVRSFLKHDLIPNLHSVAGHRMEVLLGSLLARGLHVDPYSAPVNLHGPLKKWKNRVGESSRGQGVLGRLNEASRQSRGWTWSAVPGVLVLAGMSLLALWRRDRATLMVTTLLWLQLGALLAVAPAAEYRYVFVFYLAPLLLLAGSPVQRRVEASDRTAARHEDPRTPADGPNVIRPDTAQAHRQ